MSSSVNKNPISHRLIIINSFLKDVVLYSRISLLFGPLKHWLKFFSNLIGLTRFIHQQSKKKALVPGKYQLFRNYAAREQMHTTIIDHFNLSNTPVQYLEFGVCDGDFFKWWMQQLKHENTSLVGFDTFEGLPEHWGLYKQGDMYSGMPVLEDKRASFEKGLFQHTLHQFLQTKYRKDVERTIIHLDADLFSSTLFVLTSLAPYLKSGDILLFDEFSVPNHEFYAWDLFCQTYYVDYEVLGWVNNFYQTAILYKGMGKFD